MVKGNGCFHMNADINDDAPGEASSGARVELRSRHVVSSGILNIAVSK